MRSRVIYVGWRWKGTSSRGRIEKDVLVVFDGRLVDVRDIVVAKSQISRTVSNVFEQESYLAGAICVLMLKLKSRCAMTASAGQSYRPTDEH